MKPDEILLYEEKGRLIFWSYYFKIFKDRIEAYFLPHKQVIPFSVVESVELVEKIPWTVGRGLRYGMPRTRQSGTKYFVIRDKGIRLRLKSGRWKKIILSVNEPEKVKTLIKGRLEPDELEIG